jgi:uncharacterized coiled-coil protein SlyX
MKMSKQLNTLRNLNLDLKHVIARVDFEYEIAGALDQVEGLTHLLDGVAEYLPDDTTTDSDQFESRILDQIAQCSTEIVIWISLLQVPLVRLLKVFEERRLTEDHWEALLSLDYSSCFQSNRNPEAVFSPRIDALREQLKTLTCRVRDFTSQVQKKLYSGIPEEADKFEIGEALQIVRERLWENVERTFDLLDLLVECTRASTDSNDAHDIDELRCNPTVDE